MQGTCYEIVVKGRLSERFASTFDGLALAAQDGETLLSGELADQAQLYGVLLRLRDLGVELVSVNEAGRARRTASLDGRDNARLGSRGER
jgi:hypothetical protein